MFSPKSVAVIGATEAEGSVGRTLVLNLRQGGFTGRIYAVNPKHKEVLGLPCHARIGDLRGEVDLAVIATPAATVPGVVGECLEAEVRGAVVISAGFRERGPEGADLERQIQERLRGGAMRLVGPNCLGIMIPGIGLNATFAHDMGRPGRIAFLSQSGALETAILDWSIGERVGFSAIVSTGSMVDVGWGDLIDYFAGDPDTQAILLYMESVGDARLFLSAAREAALRKPILVIKAGRSEVAARAAASHTGAMTGSDEVFDAALRRCGVLRVQSISDLFHLAETLARQPRPAGPKLTIVTNAGGPAVLATDALIAGGGELAPLPEASVNALSEFLSPHWSHANPIDVLGDAGSEEYARTLDVAIRDPQSDGLLAILAPQGMTDPAEVANKLKPYARGFGKPILASWMGGKLMARGVEILNEAGIPTFAYADTAARAFCYMWRYSDNLRALYETPSFGEDVEGGNAPGLEAREILEEVRAGRRTILSEIESKRVLALYGIPVVETHRAQSPDEAVAKARACGFPVVLKVFSEFITHKTEAGGVKLSLADEDAVRRAYAGIEQSVRERAGADKFQGVSVQRMVRMEGYELIIGSSVDSQFGPVILFGSGGQLVEVYRDRALALPPLNATLAQRLIERTRVYRALQGVRGRAAVNLDELKLILVRFSRLLAEQPWIKEVDVNPLLASPGGIVALDARIVLHSPETLPETLPRLAIRPYPMRYVGQWTMKNGDTVVIRPIRPEDEPLMVKFHQALSDRSVYLRYFHMMRLSARVSHERMIQRCFVDYDREIALVADFEDPRTSAHEILAVGRLTKLPGEQEAEVGVIVRDDRQKQGLGVEMLRRLIEVARHEKVGRIVAHTLPENLEMRSLAERFGFQVRKTEEMDTVVAVLDL